MKRYLYTFTKYRFKGLSLLVVSDDNKFYRLPFESNHKYYGLKELRVKYHNGKNKLLYNGKRYTKEQLEKLKYEHKELLKEDVNRFYVPDNFDYIK